MYATVQEASEATGWSPRMLRYVEQRGLVVPARSPSGYRLYSDEHLERLRSLRTLLDSTGLEISDVAVALRLQREESTRAVVQEWLGGVPLPEAGAPTSGTPAARSTESAASGPGAGGVALEALRWEQERHLRLLQSAVPSRNNVKDSS